MTKRSDRPKTTLSDCAGKAVKTLRFVEKHGVSPEHTKPFEMVIEDLLQRADERGLRRALNELIDWIREFPPSVIREYEAEFGNVVQKRRDDSHAIIRRVLARGRIRTDSEYEVLLETAGELAEDESDRDQLSRINSLLEAFHRAPN